MPGEFSPTDRTLIVAWAHNMHAKPEVTIRSARPSDAAGIGNILRELGWFPHFNTRLERAAGYYGHDPVFGIGLLKRKVVPVLRKRSFHHGDF